MKDEIRLVTQKIEEQGGFVGRKILYFEETTSTQDMARKLVGQLENGEVIVAKNQLTGRGRKGRVWISMPGCLNFTVLLTHEDRIFFTANYSLVAGVCIAEAIRKITSLPVTIKWPNDLFLEGKKFCGILCEGLRAGGKNVILLGVGINVNTPEEKIPTEFKSSITSLYIEKKEVIPLVDLMVEVFSNLESGYLTYLKNGFSPFINRWKELNNTLGKKVKIIAGTYEFEGIAEDLEEDGSLVVRKYNNGLVRVTSKDVSLRFDQAKT